MSSAPGNGHRREGIPEALSRGRTESVPESSADAGPPTDEAAWPFLEVAAARRRAEEAPSTLESLRALPLRPSEGWLTLGLVILMAMTLAWSVDDPRWILGRSDLTDFLAPVAALGVLWGFLSAKAGWPRWVAHLLGAVAAALIVPIAIGSVLAPDGWILSWFEATARSTVAAYLDLARRGQTVTQQYGHFMLALGLLCWATGQYMGYVTFHHRRPLNAVILGGILLVASMSITIREQLPFLVIFSVAALLLLVRTHTFEERASWLRRRIGDPVSLGSFYMRGGTTFVTAAVLGALLLTVTASSAPLAGAWTGVDQQIIDWGQQIQRFLPCCGAGTRINGVSFGPNADIGAVWFTQNTPAVAIKRSPGDKTDYYWAAATYNTFNLNGWSRGSDTEIARKANQPLLKDTLEGAFPPSAKKSVSFNVSALAYRDDVLLTPTVPLRTMGSISEDVDTRVFVLAGGSYLLSVVSDQHENYKVSVDVPTVGDTGINENLLRAAGTDYPTEVKALYLSYPKEAIGANARALLKEIEPSVEQDTPYDWALATQEYLRSDAFHYDTDVRRFNCSGNVVECFARDRYGFCQYFATEMAILLRSKGIPTRMVQGFLPGERDASGANELLTYASSHAWVQVYFPGVGWVNFDPTKGQGVVIPLPAGPAVLPRPSASPLAVPSGSLDREQDPNLRSPRGGAAGPADAGGPSSPGSLPFVIVGLLLAAAIGGLAFLAYRRGPRGPAQPDSVYEGVVRLAARLGFAPRATQTVYEYAGALGEELPGARPSLQVVAQAKVEVAYGHRVLGQDRISALREAQRRLRVTLLRLLFRRRRWRGSR